MSAEPNPANVLRGALLMLGAALCFAAMSGVVGWLSTELHPFQVAFFRCLFGLIVLLPWVLRRGFNWRTTRIRLFWLRALLGSAAMMSFFWGLSVLPLAEAVTLSFTAPLFVTVLAPIALGEVVRARRWGATLVGFIGVLVVMRPGLEGFRPESWVVLGSAALMGGSVIVIKRLAATEPTDRVVLYMALMMAPIMGVAAAPFWQWPSDGAWMLAVVLGALGTAGHILFTASLRVAEASAVMPFDFIRLPAAAFLGYLLFGQAVDVWVWVGGGIIFAAGLYILQRERAVSRLPTARDRVV